ncbi:unnamed protein product, partial [Laminaria digitata]
LKVATQAARDHARLTPDVNTKLSCMILSAPSLVEVVELLVEWDRTQDEAHKKGNHPAKQAGPPFHPQRIFSSDCNIPYLRNLPWIISVVSYLSSTIISVVSIEHNK